MRVLVTGGTGFLGKATALRLKTLGHDVTVLGRNLEVGTALQGQGIAFVRADLSDAERVAVACAGQDQVIHCAALASPWGKYNAFYQANVEGTRNVVSGCLAARVKRIINISTPSVYFDYRPRLQIKESDPLPVKQVTAYGATKLLADQEMNRATDSGIEVIHLRPRAIFGPGDKTVLGRLIRTAQSGRVPLIAGGKSLVDMTYIDNAVDAILLALVAPSSVSGRVYNITNGEPLETKQMISVLTGKLGMKVRFRPLPFAVAHGLALATESWYRFTRKKGEPPLTRYAVGLMSKSQTLDIGAAKRDLGYVPKVSLDEGFERFAKWWLVRN